MRVKHTKTMHPKVSKDKRKALEKEARAINKPTNTDYTFTFNGTSYEAVQTGGNYNVRVD